jgi:hypothetical protein
VVSVDGIGVVEALRLVENGDLNYDPNFARFCISGFADQLR